MVIVLTQVCYTEYCQRNHSYKICHHSPVLEAMALIQHGDELCPTEGETWGDRQLERLHTLEDYGVQRLKKIIGKLNSTLSKMSRS